MITTIITSPEIEKHMDLESLKKGENNKINEYKLRIASGGVYTSYIVKLLQGEPLILGFVGGLGGRHIKNYLDKNRIKSSFIYMNNEMIARFILNEENTKTVLLDENIFYDETDFKNLKHKIFTSLEKTSIYSISASFKNSSEKNITVNICEFLKKRNKPFILDIKNGYIDELINFSPKSIIADMSQFLEIKDKDDIKDKLEFLRLFIKKNYTKYIIVLDADFIYCISKNKIVKFYSKKGSSTDKSAIAGALAIAIKRNYEFEKIMKLIAGIANIFDYRDFPDLPNRKDIYTKKSSIKLIEIYANGVYTDDV